MNRLRATTALRAPATLATAALATALACALTACGPTSNGTASIARATSPTLLSETTPTAPTPPPASPTSPPASATPAVPAQLDVAAEALAEQGRGAFSDVWGALAVDGDGGRVVLYATDLRRGQELVDAARQAHPETTATPVEVRRCAYTAKAEQQATQRILDRQRTGGLPFPVFAVGPMADGSGVQVHASEQALGDAAFTRLVRQAAGEVPVSFQVSRPVIPADAVAAQPPR
ncbi:hypothetical protein AB0K51_12575 [Kitasatospora sp. NPDC049285]|uniref:hypothetical protein n=1 Tax=Kitasatospora sp. NPDC049285 TaxID=3157096 RepID=UPI00343EA0C4